MEFGKQEIFQANLGVLCKTGSCAHQLDQTIICRMQNISGRFVDYRTTAFDPKPTSFPSNGSAHQISPIAGWTRALLAGISGGHFIDRASNTGVGRWQNLDDKRT
jgi:hypothetical protein